MSRAAPTPVEEYAAEEAVKAYIRKNRARLAADGELLAMLLPERFEANGVKDFQRFIIDRLTRENQALRMEIHGLLRARERVVRLSDGVRRAVLELIDARSFDEAISVAVAAAPAFGAVQAAICVESEDRTAPGGAKSVHFIKPGTIGAILGPGGMRAVLAGGGSILIGPEGRDCRSVSVFRLRLGREAPAAAYVLGAAVEGSLEGDHASADLGFFARSLERAIRAWLELPKL